jgi:hypothetical protein
MSRPLRRKLPELSSAQVRMLDWVRISRGDGTVYAEVGLELPISGQFAILAMDRTLDSLERRGLVRREDGLDGFVITEAGRRELALAEGAQDEASSNA